MNLRDARKALGWTQTYLALKSNVVQQRISLLEQREDYPVSLLDALLLQKTFQRAARNPALPAATRRALRSVTVEALFPRVAAEADERLAA